MSPPGIAKSGLAELYLKVANALERSAQLAEVYAKREEIHGRLRAADFEMERARQARQAASRGRTLARRLR